MNKNRIFDVAVIGAGVFGAWTAYQLSLDGAAVVLVDSYGPGNSRASSGGESRMIRLGYGRDQIYTRMAQRSLGLWQQLVDEIGHKAVSTKLFEPTGILWLARANDPYCEATLETLKQCNAQYERLDRVEIQKRYPQLVMGSEQWAILEPKSGVLMARRLVQAVVAKARAMGVIYQQTAILLAKRDKANGEAGKGETGIRGECDSELSSQSTTANWQSVRTVAGGEIFAKKFVFACGPWLPKIFPELLDRLMYITRQEVFFFGAPAGYLFESESLPAWIDFGELVYGIPNLDNRGVKVAIDAHGPRFDPDKGDRIVSAESLAAVRSYLARRIPMLAKAAVIETRVCQYENTSNGDFLIDRHPEFENVWLVGGGSGHGFKHGPAIGEHVVGLISGNAKVEPRFGLATKEETQQREVY